MSSENFTRTDGYLDPKPLSLRQATLLTALVFLAALTSSPSILRGFTPSVISKTAPLLLIVALAVKGNFALSKRFALAWMACFSVMVLSGLQIFLNTPTAIAPINSAIILCILVTLAANMNFAAFRLLTLKWWIAIFWVVSLSSIANWILAPLVPSIFIHFDFGQFYEGNARDYLISPFGAIILQDYGAFALYRVTGILAEPGMMSIFFFVNAILGMTERDRSFSWRFGLVNLIAAFATHSVAFYAALSVTLFCYGVKKTPWRYRLFILAIVCMLALAFFDEVSDTVQDLMMRSSFDVRENDFDFLSAMVRNNPFLSLTGYAWWGEYRQIPAAFPQLFYQVGLIGVFLYSAVLFYFLKSSKLAMIAVFVYGLSIDYQDFVIFPVLLFVVRAHAFSKMNCSTPQTAP
jgi:hypothetical protein